MNPLVHNSYGKSRVRLTKVTRRDGYHDLKELTADLTLEGDFEDSYTEGDNRQVIATDTMKNTVYALARHHPLDDLESFGLDLAAHFVDTFAQVAAATIQLKEDAWERIEANGAAHPISFVGGRKEKRVCTVTRTGGEARVVSGLEDLLVLKTTDSSFSGFVRDAYTTLPDTDDRILATSVTAHWTYDVGVHDWNGFFAAIRQSMLDAFVAHESRSVQQTLYAMGQAVLAACPAVSELTLHLPNSHRLLVNLSPFGLDNPNIIFVPTDEPYGMISGTIRRA